MKVLWPGSTRFDLRPKTFLGQPDLTRISLVFHLRQTFFRQFIQSSSVFINSTVILLDLIILSLSSLSTEQDCPLSCREKYDIDAKRASNVRRYCAFTMKRLCNSTFHLTFMCTTYHFYILYTIQ